MIVQVTKYFKWKFSRFIVTIRWRWWWSGLNITKSNEGTPLSKMVRSFDFVGNASYKTNSGNAVTVTINTGSGGGSVPSGTISSSKTITKWYIIFIEQLPSGLVSSSNNYKWTCFEFSKTEWYIIFIKTITKWINIFFNNKC